MSANALTSALPHAPSRLGRLLQALKAFPVDHPISTGLATGIPTGVGLAIYQNATNEAPSLGTDVEQEHPDYGFKQAFEIPPARVGHLLGFAGGAVGAHMLADGVATKVNEMSLGVKLDDLRRKFRDTLIAEQQLAASDYAPTLPDVSAGNTEAVHQNKVASGELVDHLRKQAGAGDAMKYKIHDIYKLMERRLHGMGYPKDADGNPITTGEYNPIPAMIATTAGGGGLALGMTEGFRRTAEADPNRALITAIKNDVKTRLGPTGRIPIQLVGEGDPTLQPLGQGAKALINPNRGSDVLNML